MRQIVHNLDSVKRGIHNLIGRPLTVTVRRGRNHREQFQGCVQDVYAAIFTIRRLEAEEILSFSYNDVLARNVRFTGAETSGQTSG